MQKRRHSYDLLRIISTFMVMLIHVNAYYFIPLLSQKTELSFTYVIESIFNIVTRFSVPCFIMISGAFNLQESNKDYKKFYSKIGYKIVVPFLMIAISILMIVEIVTLFRFGYKSCFGTLVSFLTGSFMNWWFMYMIIGLYILTPLVARFKEMISPRTFGIVTLVWLFLGFLSQSTTEYGMAYSFGNVFAYLGYYMLGSFIYDNVKTVKRVGLLWIVIIVLWGVTFWVRYLGVSKYVISAYASFFSPTIMISSICVFVFFTNLHFSHNLMKLSGCTYYMYLFHTPIYQLVLSIIGSEVIVNEVVTIIIVSIVTFFLSWFCSRGYQLLWNQMGKHWKIRKKWECLLERVL